MIAENLPDVLSKLSLGADGVVVHNARILECRGKQEKMATLTGSLSDVLSKDGAKVPDEAVEATAVDQAEGGFQSQILAAKIGDFKSGRVGVSGGEAAAVLDGRRAIVEAQNGEALASQPTANLTVSATHVDNALILREPAGLNRVNEFLLRLVGFPEGPKFGVEPPAFPYAPVSPVHPIGEQLLDVTLEPTCQSPPVSHGDEPAGRTWDKSQRSLSRLKG